MDDIKFDNILKKALLLETIERTQFLNEIEDDEIKEKIAFLLDDDTKLTDFIIKTSAGTAFLSDHKIKDLQSGDKINQFVIIKLIAKGGMGSVYLAYDEKLKRNVAIKTIRSEYLNNTTSQKRFQIEAQILSQINHPSICQIYDYIDYDDGDLLVLELVEGKTLNQLESNNKEKLDIFIQIASALVAAHDKNIIHRDLKPDNIMYTNDGKVKVLDFGIAKSKQENIIKQSKHDNTQNIKEVNKDLTKAGSLMGTLIYMSPEQASIQEISKASDIYSFAIIMQELLTGVPAYRLNDTEDLKKQVINAELIAPDSLPREFQKLIVMMTDINPCKRPTACDVQKHLSLIKDIPIKKTRKLKYGFIIVVAMLLFFVVIYQGYEFSMQQKSNKFMTQVRKETGSNKDKILQIYNLPIHDVTNELQEVRQLNLKIREKILANQILSQYDKNLLLGESYYFDNDYENAIKYLGKVWKSGPKDNSIAHKLGSSHNLMFWQNTSGLASNTNPKSDVSKLLQDSRNNHKTQSLYYYNYFPNRKVPKALLVKAQEYFFNGELQMSLDVLDFDDANKNGLSQVYMFKARIYEELVNNMYSQNNFEQAHNYLVLAEQAYLKAIEFTRSYVSPYIMLCKLKTQKIRSEIYYAQEDPLEYYKKAINTCQQVLVINPVNAFSFDNMAEINYLYAKWKLTNGIDFSEEMRLANKWNRKSLQIEETIHGYSTQGIIYDLYALKKQESGQNPLEDIKHAVNAYNKIIEMDPSQISLVTANLLYSMVVKMQYLLAHGQSMQDDIVFVRELMIREENSKYNDSENLNSKYINVGYVYLLIAYSEFQKEQSPIQWIEKSITAYQHVIDEVGERPYAYGGLAENLLLKAEYEFKNNINPEVSISLAEQKIDHANKISNKVYWNLLTKANIEKIKIKVAIQQKTMDANAFKKAHKLYQASLNINAIYAATHLHIARLYELELQLAQNNKQKSSIINNGLAALNQCLTVSSEMAEAYILKAKFIKYAQKNNITYNKQDMSIRDLEKKAFSINPIL